MSKSDATTVIERIAWNVDEAAAALGIDKERMGGLIRAGTVPHITLGNRRLVGKRALEQWLTERCLANVVQAELAPGRPPLRARVPRRSQ